MSILSLFRRQKPVSSTSGISENAQQVIQDIHVDPKVFVDNEAPGSETNQINGKNPVELYLEQPFEWEGYTDGYSQPNMDLHDQKIRKIRSEFRKALDKTMDARRSDVIQLRVHIIETSGLSARMEAMLNEKVKQLESIIHELDTHKILSVEDEGMVSSAIHAYKLGFIKGVEQYQKEKLLAGSTGLYNY